MNISAQLLPRTSAEPSTLEIKFSMCHPPNTYACLFLFVGWLVLDWIGLDLFGLVWFVTCRGVEGMGHTYLFVPTRPGGSQGVRES
jgi:hypothetical protein